MVFFFYITYSRRNGCLCCVFLVKMINLDWSYVFLVTWLSLLIRDNPILSWLSWPLFDYHRHRQPSSFTLFLQLHRDHLHVLASFKLPRVFVIRLSRWKTIKAWFNPLIYIRCFFNISRFHTSSIHGLFLSPSCGVGPWRTVRGILELLGRLSFARKWFSKFLRKCLLNISRFHLYI